MANRLILEPWKEHAYIYEYFYPVSYGKFFVTWNQYNYLQSSITSLKAYCKSINCQNTSKGNL